VPSGSPWSCTCRFASSHHLPCRHQFFVSRSAVFDEIFSVSALATRWRMSSALQLIPQLKLAIDCLTSVRLASLIPMTVRLSVSMPAKNSVDYGTRRKRITYVKLKRNQDSDHVVLDAIEKRNIVEGECERVVSRLMALGTARFWSAAAKP
jgi:hypothetical protein